MSLTPDFTVKRHDVGRLLSGHFEESDGSRPNLSGASACKIFARDKSTNQLKINGATFQLTDPTQGVWSYALTANDVDTSGYYDMEFQVTRSGHVDTFPTDPEKPFSLLLIQEDLGE